MNLAIPQIPHILGKKMVPGDKSISHRALMIGAIADGKTEIHSCSRAADPMSTLSCIRQLGIVVKDHGDKIILYGKGKTGLRKPDASLDAGNSGTTMRLLSGLLVGQRFSSMLIGDASLSQRPMKRVLDPLHQMGANISGTLKNTAPLTIEPVDHLNAIRYDLPVPSAQVKSLVLFAGLFADSTTTVFENTQSRDHTERMLGLPVVKENGGFRVESSQSIVIPGKNFFVPGDISSAAFFLSAGLIVPGSDFIIQDVGINPTRSRIIEILKNIGGNITVENKRTIEGEPIGDLHVVSSHLKGVIDLHGAEIVDLIDEIPILAVTALFSEGSFRIRDAKELRSKETDRISALVHNIRLLGCDVEEYDDGFSFEAKENYLGAFLPSYGDHRIAMAFGVAGLRIPRMTIQDIGCVDISFPGFWKELLPSG